MVNARSSGSEPVLLLCKDVVHLEVVLQSVVQDARVDLGDTAHNCDAAVLQRVSRVFVFLWNRNNITEVPVRGIVFRAGVSHRVQFSLSDIRYLDSPYQARYDTYGRFSYQIV